VLGEERKASRASSSSVMVVISEFADERGPLRAAGELEDLHRLAQALRRVNHFARHLRASVNACTGVAGSSFSQDLSKALVPMPGTWHHEHWLEVLARQSNGSLGAFVLSQWMQFFFKSGPRMRRALRRLLVLSAHVSAQPFQFVPIEVN